MFVDGVWLAETKVEREFEVIADKEWAWTPNCHKFCPVCGFGTEICDESAVMNFHKHLRVVCVVWDVQSL